VCVVNEEFVRRHLAGREPLGALVNVAPVTLTPTKAMVREVVGVIGQVKERPDEVENALQIYVPMTQNSWYTASIVVQTAGDPMSLRPAIEAAISRIDNDQPRRDRASRRGSPHALSRLAALWRRSP
jgi:putative ABC transport system permease protein